MMKNVFLILFLLSATMGYAQNKSTSQQKKSTNTAKKTTHPNPIKKNTMPLSKEREIEITTDYGVMIAKLSDATPLHRDNFINLVKQGFYDGLLFHRVIHEFMIQGGDPASKNATDSTMLGGGEVKGVNRIPAEFNPNLIHKKGVLAAARDNNPAKASSNCQFYIVQGKPFDSAQLNTVYEHVKATTTGDFKYTADQKEIYQRIGGTPFLDQNYTVFGEVISGLDVIDKIAAVQVRPGDRPVKDVHMKIRLLN